MLLGECLVAVEVFGGPGDAVIEVFYGLLEGGWAGVVDDGVSAPADVGGVGVALVFEVDAAAPVVLDDVL